MESIAEARKEEVQREVETLEFMRRIAEGMEAQNKRLEDTEKIEERRPKENTRLIVWTLVVAAGSFLAGITMPFLMKQLEMGEPCPHASSAALKSSSGSSEFRARVTL